MAKVEIPPIVAKFGEWEITLQPDVVKLLQRDGLEKGVAYFLQYGLQQSVQDSIAGMKKELGEATNDDGTRKYSDAEIATLMHDAQDERFVKAMAGDIRAGSRGPRVMGIDAVMRDVADEWIKAAAAKAGKSLPKKDAYTTLRVKYIEANGDKIRAEAERRMAQTAVTEFGDDLLGALLAATQKAA